MARRPLPALATTISFIDRINHTDLVGLTELMHADHRLVVLEEPPIVGRDANVDAWRGYFTAIPEYVIHPRFLAASVWTARHYARPELGTESNGSTRVRHAPAGPRREL